MLILRLTRILLLFFCLLLGLTLAGVHQLLCHLRLATQGSVNQLARWWFISILRVLNVRVRLNADPLEHRGLIVANHISWLDIPVLGSVLPTYFLSKAEVKDMPVLGWLTAKGGTLFIHRGRHDLEELRDQMQRRLGDGHFLTFFPEGTTGRCDRLGPFHPRLFAAAIETGVPVVPVAVHYRNDDPSQPKIPFEEESFLSNIWRVLGIWRTEVEVTVLPALESAGMPRRALADQARRSIAQALNLPDDPLSPTGSLASGRPAPTPESQP